MPALKTGRHSDCAPKLRLHRRCRPAACGYAALRRILFIHERLGNGRRADATSLAKELEVAARTIKRDVEFMRTELGAPIEWEPSTRTYFYSRECDILPLLRLEADEALALVLAGHTFAAWRGSSLGRALTAALGKIAAVVGGAVSLPASDVSDLLSQPDGGREAETEHRFFAVMLEAIRRHRELRIDYQKPGSAAAERRTVHPLHLAYLDHAWMLVVHDPARKGFRNFLLTRIHAAEKTGHRFERPVNFDARAYLAGSFGRFTGGKTFDVRIRFDAFAAPYIREHRWHDSQGLADGPDDSLEVTLHLNHLIEVQRWVLSWGAHAEALAPAELRESIAREIAALAARYQASAPDPATPGRPASLPVC